MPERQGSPKISIRRVEIRFPVGSELDGILQPRGRRRWGHYIRRFLERHIPELREFLEREAPALPDPDRTEEEEA